MTKTYYVVVWQDKDDGEIDIYTDDMHEELARAISSCKELRVWDDEVGLVNEQQPSGAYKVYEAELKLIEKVY